jgi:hypothetical protein
MLPGTEVPSFIPPAIIKTAKRRLLTDIDTISANTQDAGLPYQ